MHKINDNHGFTLIEILVVMGMIAVIASLGLFMSMGSFQGSSFRNERSNVISALYKARSQAINNVCVGATCTSGISHGVHFETGKFTIFQGISWSDISHDSGLDEIIEINPTIQITGLVDVIFAKLSGDVSAPGNLIMKDTGTNTSTISINSEGQITWTN